MKRILYFLFTLGSTTFAQTFVTNPIGSGIWTLAGSPYIVQTQVTVPAANVLTIEPGVIVKFEPAMKMTVNGQLIAAGTIGAPIIFQAVDTVNWSNDATTDGGWNGIHFHQYGGGGTDQSRLEYCTIEDGKYGHVTPVMYANACTSERGLKIYNCTFRHNRSGQGTYVADPPLRSQTYLSTDTMDIKNCSFYNNASIFGVIQTANYPAGFTRISGCHIYQNTIGCGIYASNNNLLIENNEVDHNSMFVDAAPIKVTAGTVIIRGNKVHHNQSEDYGGIACRAGNVTIENNLVCNNQQIDPFCGITGGGAGINIAHNNGSSFFDTYYIVRNNIIANNHSAFGGGGMYVFNARATVSNNHFINNHTDGMGSGLQVTNPNSEVYLKNNLFHSQFGPGNVDTVKAMYILSAGKIQFDNNYIPSPFCKSVYASSGYLLIGDTLDNVIGTDPDLFNPTMDNSYLTDATTADFHILVSSPCVGEGDTAGCFPASIDYAGNIRIQGVIDIGAYEYTVGENVGIEPIAETPALKLMVYPNPTEAFSSFMVVTPETAGSLSIYDINGKMVYGQIITSSTSLVDLGSMKGIYFIRFNGSVTATGKILIR